jgi:hypothetical protein
MNQWLVDIPEEYWQQDIRDFWCSHITKDEKYVLTSTPFSKKHPEKPSKVMFVPEVIVDCQTVLEVGKWYRGYIRNLCTQGIMLAYSQYGGKKFEELWQTKQGRKELFEERKRRRLQAELVVVE